MISLFAFLHHVAAFTLVAALTVEFVLIRMELTAESARRIRLADIVLGASAALLLAVGLLRVFYFEKGASYYFHSAPFIAKLALFVAAGLLSIYPTVEFSSWGKFLKQGSVPIVSPGKLRAVRTVIHCELIGAALILLCAVLMARGVGYFGA
jgi:putative membrane protein